MLRGDPEGWVRTLGLRLSEKVIKHLRKHIVLDGNCLTMGLMTKLRHQQPSLWHPGLTKDIEDLWEPWMRLVDRLLEDEQLLDTMPQAGARANAGREGAVARSFSYNGLEGASTL
jgi:hypothetical protein